MRGMGLAAAAVACAILGASGGQLTDGVRDLAGTYDRAQAPDRIAKQPVAAARPYIGKPRPPVTVALAPGGALEAGVPGAITLIVRTGVPISGVQIAVEGMPG